MCNVKGIIKGRKPEIGWKVVTKDSNGNYYGSVSCYPVKVGMAPFLERDSTYLGYGGRLLQRVLENEVSYNHTVTGKMCFFRTKRDAVRAKSSGLNHVILRCRVRKASHWCAWKEPMDSFLAAELVSFTEVKS